MSRKGYKKLSGQVKREYERKGYSPKKANYIGNATAGKVKREKDAKKGHRSK
ncbi:MAG: hypothetical protein ACREHG_04275 [Candidatus Saccharimonadales bacterium]